MVRLALTYGDPAGIGPEITAKALAQGLIGATPVVAGDMAILQEGARVAGVTLPPPGPETWEHLPVSLSAPALPVPGVEASACGAHALALLHAVRQELVTGRLAGVVTAPVHKGAIRRVEPGFIGHTEYFGAMPGVGQFGMLLVVEPFRALHVTTHVALAQVPALLTRERVLAHLELARRALHELGEPDRLIGVCGLNPHAGEGGAFGDEESRIIQPAIEEACARGIRAVGPLPPDAAFPRAASGEFGLIVCMYHDQGHVALKLVGMDRGINVTVGLPFVRTSVDHGTAFDIAGTGVARPNSLLAAWQLAVKLVRQRSLQA